MLLYCVENMFVHSLHTSVATRKCAKVAVGISLHWIATGAGSVMHSRIHLVFKPK